VSEALRIGILGTSRIAPTAIVAAARGVTGVEVTAVASRDAARAAAFAEAHGIASSHTSYESLLSSGEVDAVYLALPTSENRTWAQAALEHGLHVLVEKPFARNAREAEEIGDAAAAAERLAVEAFHWRYHPIAQAMIDGAALLGELRSAKAVLEVAQPEAADIRWDPRLAGGAMMDLGSYTVHWLRTALGSEPDVVAAEAELAATGVDGAMNATLRFPGRISGAIRVSMLGQHPPEDFQALVEIAGARGHLRVENPLVPQAHHRIELTVDGSSREITVSRRPSYEFQLEAFRDAALQGSPMPTGGSDAVANMRTIDAVYAAAGVARNT
jgi:predicted dehydrogenase